MPSDTSIIYQRICPQFTRYSLEDIKAGHTIVVSVYRTGDSLKSITDRADQALYVAKRVGKNQIASEMPFRPKENCRRHILPDSIITAVASGRDKKHYFT